MNNKTRIGFLGNNITPGGGSASLYLLVKSLPNDLYDKYVYASTCSSEFMKVNFLKHCHKVDVVDIKEICSCQTYDTPHLLFLKNRLSAGKSCKKLLNTLIKDKIDILHINNSVFAHVTEYIKKNSSIKIVSHVRELIDHNGIGELQEYIISRINKYSDSIITISDNEARMFPFHKKLTVLANPFDFSNIDNITSDYRKKNNIDTETVLVGMMGRFSYSKGHLEYLKALKHIIDKNEGEHNFLFVLIGISPPKVGWKVLAKKILFKKDYHTEVKKFIHNNKLDNYLKLVPYTQEVFEIIKSMDIMVRPSLNGDPWGRDIIESMALEKPIVATGSSDFYIINGETGFLVSPKSHFELAEKIEVLIKDKLLREKMGENGYRVVLEKCDIRKYGKKVVDIYGQNFKIK